MVSFRRLASPAVRLTLLAAVLGAASAVDVDASEVQPSATSCTVSGTKSGAPVGKDQQDHLLLQARANLTKVTDMKRHEGESATMSDASVALHIREFSNNEKNVARVIQKGIQAILKAVTHFAAVPPNVEKGLEALGDDLFEAISDVLTEKQKQTGDYIRFKEAWTKSFEEIPSTAKSVTHAIQTYAEEGRPQLLVDAIGQIITGVGSIVANALPPATGLEVMKYLDAVGDGFRAIGESWAAFEEGETVEGIEAIYLGIRDVVGGLIPRALQDSKVYNSIIAALDHTIGNLSTHVIEYERLMLENHTCWRSTKPRARRQPRICDSDYVWDGAHTCLPRGGLLLQLTEADATTLDETVQSKPDNNKPTRPAVGAQCDPDSDFAEKVSNWCLQDCPSGFHPKENFNSKCITACAGQFRAETPEMCGSNQGMVMKAIMDMVTMVLNSAFVLADNIQKMKEDGVDPETLVATIQVFIDMGKPFAKRTCPVPDTGLRRLK